MKSSEFEKVFASEKKWAWTHSLAMGGGVIGGLLSALISGPTTGLNGGWTGLVVAIGSLSYLFYRIQSLQHTYVLYELTLIKEALGGRQ